MAKKHQIKSKSPVSDSNSKFRDYLLSALFCVFILLFSFTMISGDDDVFWHLSTGRYIIAHLQIPSVDVFSYPTYGQEWSPSSWLWDVLVYGCYSFSGFTGITLFKSFILLAIFYSMWRILKDLLLSRNTIMLLLLIAALGIVARVDLRPYLASYLFLLSILSIIVRQYYLERKIGNKFYLIPLIFLLWTNIHLSVISGLVLLGVYIFLEILIYFGKFNEKNVPALKSKEIRILILVFVLSVLFIGFNPKGFHAYFNLSGKLPVNIYEWYSPFSDIFYQQSYSYIYFSLIALGLYVLLKSFRMKEYFVVLVAIVFFGFSFMAIRFIVDYILVLVILCGIVINRLQTEKRKASVVDYIQNKSYIYVLLFLFLIFSSYMIVSNVFYTKYFNPLSFGLGVKKNYYPEKLFDFVKEQKISEIGHRPYNSYECGGYFLWRLPENKNFIDSRLVDHKRFREYLQMLNMETDFRKVFADNNFDYIIYFIPSFFKPSHELMLKEMKFSLLSYIFQESETWKLIFWNDNSLLFVRNEAKFKELIDKYEFRYLSPYNFIFRKESLLKGLETDKIKVAQEIERKQIEEPEGNIIKSMSSQLNSAE